MAGPDEEIAPLREWRIRRYLTYRALAEKARVSTQTLLRAERGERLNDITQRKIADALEIRVTQVAEFLKPSTEHQRRRPDDSPAH